MTDAEIVNALEDIDHDAEDDEIHWEDFKTWWLKDHMGESVADKL